MGALAILALLGCGGVLAHSPALGQSRSMQPVIVGQEGVDSVLGQAVGKDKKGKLSMLLYAVAIPTAFIHQWIADAIYTFVALV